MRRGVRVAYSPQLGRIVRFESEVSGIAGPPDRELIELVEVAGG